MPNINGVQTSLLTRLGITAATLLLPSKSRWSGPSGAAAVLSRQFSDPVVHLNSPHIVLHDQLTHYSYTLPVKSIHQITLPSH
ncbi:hypothetical protein HAX54_033160, partial [Datura stramonium]|nr:hypothetical protein [Datura stramonium]